MVTDNVVFNSAVTTTGQVLLSCGHPAGSSLHVYQAATNDLHELDRGEFHHYVSPLSNGDLLLSRIGTGNVGGLFRCRGVSMDCERLKAPNSPFPWIGSPDGRRAATWSDGSIQVLNLADGSATDIGPGKVAFCLMRWSGPSTIWFKDLLTLLWTELDVDSKTLTGRTIPGTGGNCLDGIPDFTLPPGISSPVKISVKVESEIRVRSFRAP
jgi:hypothetical protein